MVYLLTILKKKKLKLCEQRVIRIIEKGDYYFSIEHLCRQHQLNQETADRLRKKYAPKERSLV